MDKLFLFIQPFILPDRAPDRPEEWLVFLILFTVIRFLCARFYGRSWGHYLFGGLSGVFALVAMQLFILSAHDDLSYIIAGISCIAYFIAIASDPEIVCENDNLHKFVLVLTLLYFGQGLSITMLFQTLGGNPVLSAVAGFALAYVLDALNERLARRISGER